MGRGVEANERKRGVRITLMSFVNVFRAAIYPQAQEMYYLKRSLVGAGSQDVGEQALMRGFFYRSTACASRGYPFLTSGVSNCWPQSADGCSPAADPVPANERGKEGC